MGLCSCKDQTIDYEQIESEGVNSKYLFNLIYKQL